MQTRRECLTALRPCLVRTITKLTVLGVSLGLSAQVGTRSQAGVILDLTGNVGASGVINGAKFQTTELSPAGTGIVNPFLTIKNDSTESGYNTSGTLGSNGFDQHSGSKNRNRDLPVSSLIAVNLGGATYYRFSLDIAESQSGLNPYISINQIQVFQTSTTGQTGGSEAANGRLNTTAPVALTGLISVYDMNSAAKPTDNRVDVAPRPGNGVADLYLYIPTASFSGTGTHILFYSQLGRSAPVPKKGTEAGGPYSSSGSFEEWAAFEMEPKRSEVVTAVPEPATYFAAALLSLPILAQLRRTRKMA